MTLRNVVLTLVIGAIGAGIAWALMVPAPFLTGPALFVTIASVLGLKTDVPIPLRHLCFVLIGIGMGAGVTPEVVAAAAGWPVPLAVLSVALVVILVGGAALVGRLFAIDRTTARLAATPGHLSFILSMSTELKADVAVVSVIQSLRVLVLTLLVPLVAAILSDADLSMSVAPVVPMALGPLAIVTAVSVALGLVMMRLRVPAALLLAGMAVSTLTHGTGLTPGGMPLWASIPAFVIMGTLIGTRFSGVTLHLVIRAAQAAAVLTVLALAVTLIAAEIVHRMMGLPRVDLLIAFAPGGLETMAAMSIMLDADPAFTAVHHIYRLVLLSFLVPLLVRPEPRGAPGE